MTIWDGFHTSKELLKQFLYWMGLRAYEGFHTSKELLKLYNLLPAS